MSIACVAIVGKEHDPLYLRTFTSSNPASANSPNSVPFAADSIAPGAAGPLHWNNDQALHFHYLVHTSLDAIEEKTSRLKRAAPGTSLPGGTDLYLGLLFAVDSYKVYGYTTNTKARFVVVLQDCAQDVNMKTFLRDLHSLYIATVCNPFADLGAPIQNPTFEMNVQKMTSQWFYRG